MSSTDDLKPEDIAAEEDLSSIQAADFSPVSDQDIKKKPWVKPVSVAVGLVFCLLAGVLWYIFTARSVYLEFEPGAESVQIEGGFSIKIGQRYLMRPRQLSVNRQSNRLLRCAGSPGDR